VTVFVPDHVTPLCCVVVPDDVWRLLLLLLLLLSLPFLLLCRCFRQPDPCAVGGWAWARGGGTAGPSQCSGRIHNDQQRQQLLVGTLSSSRCVWYSIKFGYVTCQLSLGSIMWIWPRCTGGAGWSVRAAARL